MNSKRFRVVSNQRNTEEGRETGVSVLAARKMEREPRAFSECKILKDNVLTPCFGQIESWQTDFVFLRPGLKTGMGF